MARPGGQMNPTANLGQLTEVRNRILFLLFALLIYRVGTYITVPGINPRVMADLFESQSGGILGMVDVFAGGALGRMSLFALGVMPYITASIIIQMMGHVHPPFVELRKEGQQGQRKLTQYTRYLTVLLATVQSVGISVALQNPEVAGPSLVTNPGISFVFTATITLVTGTMFLMWLGEQITERGIGNGISMLIFAGIVAGLPTAIANVFELTSEGQMSYPLLLGVLVVAALVTYFVIVMERGQRRITINFAKRQQGRRQYAAHSSHLPLKLNAAGVIPAIFAQAIILFPGTIASFAGNSGPTSWIRDAAAFLAPGQPAHMIIYGAAIIFFCFFYTALVFNARDTADNLKKQGAFIPGIRPGEQTARYIDGVMTRLTVVGSLYITAVCLLPQVLISEFNVPFNFGGTALLIVVVVVMDFMAQLQAHMMSHQYEGLMKKSNLKGLGPQGSR
ncbi:preprotein translocase, SecY subunit [gamma proteobacterium HTCC5015]|nr:preprotein translocase, SecY subunit [gamma proteobacterium HTCC5015]